MPKPEWSPTPGRNREEVGDPKREPVAAGLVIGSLLEDLMMRPVCKARWTLLWRFMVTVNEHCKFATVKVSFQVANGLGKGLE